MSAPPGLLRRGGVLGPAGALLAGCGGGAPPTPPPAAGAPAPAPVVRPKEPDTGKALPPIAYEPKGRRDPFTPIFLGKDNAALSVSAVKLTGVVGGPSSLLALVEAPDGIGYILKPGATVALPESHRTRSRSLFRPGAHRAPPA